MESLSEVRVYYESKKFLKAEINENNTFLYVAVTVVIGVTGRELFDYAKTYNDLAGIEYGFSEPPFLKSNISGGYGLLYALNTFDYTIEN